MKDCSTKKTKAVRKWEATAEQELRPAGTRGSRLVAPHQSRRSGGKAEDPQATATDPASAPWGLRVMRMQWPPTPSPGARLARLGGQSSHVCPLPAGSLTGNSDRLNPEPVVSSLSASLSLERYKVPFLKNFILSPWLSGSAWVWEGWAQGLRFPPGTLDPALVSCPRPGPQTPSCPL